MQKIVSPVTRVTQFFYFFNILRECVLTKREFDIAICVVLRTTQMAKNGKNRLAILTIFRFRRTDVNQQA
jgi:hypothetical protein